MDPETTQLLRDPGLVTRIWGYDRQQVDTLLDRLRAVVEDPETGPAPTPSKEATVELHGIGEQVESILAAARETAEHAITEARERAAEVARAGDEAAEELRRKADEYAASTRGEADEYATSTRREADEYAASTRREADEYAASTRREVEREAEEARGSARGDAEEVVAAAEREADELLRDARLKLERIEESLEDLRERRQLVIASIERLRGSLGSVVGDAEQGTGAFVPIDEEAFEEERTAILEAGEEELAPSSLTDEDGLASADHSPVAEGEGGGGADGREEASYEADTEQAESGYEVDTEQVEVGYEDYDYEAEHAEAADDTREFAIDDERGEEPADHDYEPSRDTDEQPVRGD